MKCPAISPVYRSQCDRSPHAPGTAHVALRHGDVQGESWVPEPSDQDAPGSDVAANGYGDYRTWPDPEGRARGD